jgi:hypothetical protein
MLANYKPKIRFSAQKTPFQARGGDLSNSATQTTTLNNKNAKSAIFASFINKGYLSRSVSH